MELQMRDGIRAAALFLRSQSVPLPVSLRVLSGSVRAANPTIPLTRLLHNKAKPKCTTTEITVTH